MMVEQKRGNIINIASVSGLASDASSYITDEVIRVNGGEKGFLDV